MVVTMTVEEETWRVMVVMVATEPGIVRYLRVKIPVSILELKNASSN